MRSALLAALLILPLSATAGPNPQLLAGIESRLPHYQIDADVSQLTLSQAAALHLTLASNGDSWIEKRRKIKAILRQNEGYRQ